MAYSDSDLSCSENSLNSLDLSEEETNFEENLVLPYRFEPIAPRDRDVLGENVNSCDVNNREDRSGNTNWCRCTSCSNMDTEKESVCCQEIDAVTAKLDAFNEGHQAVEDPVMCITNHPGFASVCLDQYVLETAHYQYRQQYGEVQGYQNECMRYVGYRQLARWCWGYLGKEVRVVLPACAVSKIRRMYPAEHFTGFQRGELTTFPKSV